MGLFVFHTLIAADPSLGETMGGVRPETDEREPQTIDEVMQLLAQNGGIEARFHESRQIAILEEPVISTGMFYFAPPDLLARHVTAPGRLRIVVRDGRVSFRDETGVHTLELGSSEVARALVGNTMLLMRGDHKALVEQYQVSFRVDGDIWTLDLEPRNRVVRRIIRRLRVQGRGGELIRMESTETNGDLTLTTFSEVKRGIEFSAEALEEIFSIRPAPDPTAVSSHVETVR